jgi:YesN/AraC family two-component response regulator
MFKILLVEDNPVFRQTLGSMLRETYPSLSFAEAADAHEALEEVQKDCPQIILMDIKLPGKNGLELTKEIKNLCSDVAVIILTSYDYPEYREAARKYGADHFLVKGTSVAGEVLASIDSIFPGGAET